MFKRVTALRKKVPGFCDVWFLEEVEVDIQMMSCLVG